MPHDLQREAFRGLLRRTHFPKDKVDYVVVGSVIQVLYFTDVGVVNIKSIYVYYYSDPSLYRASPIAVSRNFLQSFFLPCIH